MSASGTSFLMGMRRQSVVLWALILAVFVGSSAFAQSFRINNIEVDGNRRIETATIQSFTGLTRGSVVDASAVNAAVQNVRGSGLFESVDARLRGSTLVLEVVEFPTVNQVAFEGNRRIKDEELGQLVRVAPRRVFSASQVEADATRLTEAYANQGRLAATVTPRIIQRSDNRVDVVFEVVEGAIIEIERVSFVGNRNFGDRRLRRVLETKQAGLFRLLVGRDTFVQDRINFDRQVLTDFYLSRGYVDFQTLSVNAELNQSRDAFFLTFRVREGQQFNFGDLSITSDLPDVDPDAFSRALRGRTGQVYSPLVVENSIARMERLAIDMGLDFVRVEPRVTRNDADLSLDIEYVLSRGPRVFVERIDIEGNTTTLDHVIRRQFRIVEGDPFNPREIRRSAERIRALGFFGASDVDAREGSSPSQVIVDVDVQEQPTGSLSFGVNYNTSDGVGVLASFRERNFLGRGQALSFNLVTGAESRTFSFDFTEPALLDRDLAFALSVDYSRTDNNNARYDTESFRVQPGLTFPVSENGRLTVRAFAESEELFDLSTSSGVIIGEAAAGRETAAGIGYTYSYDNRRSGLDPTAGVYFQFGQDFSLAGEQDYIRTSLSMGAETRVLREEVRLSAELDIGALTFNSGSSRVTDRFFPGSNTFRGFAPGGLGPREELGGSSDALGGNMFAVARFEAQFPLGLPEEYGLSGGAFLDVGSVWDLDPASLSNATGTIHYNDFSVRSSAGVSLFWETPIGPLRFNFSRALQKETLDEARNFDLTVSTSF